MSFHMQGNHGGSIVSSVPCIRKVAGSNHTLTAMQSSGSQPVVCGPLVVHGHLRGGPRARTKIYVILRKDMETENISKFFIFYFNH